MPSDHRSKSASKPAWEQPKKSSSTGFHRRKRSRHLSPGPPAGPWPGARFSVAVRPMASSREASKPWYSHPPPPPSNKPANVSIPAVAASAPASESNLPAHLHAASAMAAAGIAGMRQQGTSPTFWQATKQMMSSRRDRGAAHSRRPVSAKAVVDDVGRPSPIARYSGSERLCPCASPTHRALAVRGRNRL
jgi:hypothetical protein